MELGIILSCISLIITIIICTVNIVRTWSKMNERQATSDENLKILIANVAKLTEYLHKSIESNDRFCADIKRDIEQSSKDRRESYDLCKENFLGIGRVHNGLMLQNTTQQFMKEMMEETRATQTKTIDALNCLTNVIGKMEVILSELMKKEK